MKVKHKPGDRVVSTANWHGQKAGAIARSGRGVSVMVRWDGESEDERVYLDGLRTETDEDIAKREHESAMRTWSESRPRTEIARPLHSMRWGDNSIIGAKVGQAATPTEMRAAAAELHALADWFERRPVKP